MRTRDGFSLVELLVVVAVILIIAAIAIPALVRSRIAANEASAASSVRTLTNAELIYTATYPSNGFTCKLTDLGPYVGVPSPDASGLIDGVLASGSKAGYSFSLGDCNGPPSTMVTIKGDPQAGAGRRKFCSDQSGILHYDPGSGNCTSASAAVQ